MRSHIRAIAIAACGLVVLGVIGRWIYFKEESEHSTPSCSWPLHIHGTAPAHQVGLVRCYLKAIAEHDAAELNSVTENGTQITSGDFKYSRAARSGVATATFTPSPVDSTIVLLTIRFADGAVSNGEGIINMIAMGGPSVWRMALYDDWTRSSNSSNQPPTAGLPPS